MKNINEIRHTNKFCITPIHVEHMNKIAVHMQNEECRLCAIANQDDSLFIYTVRYMTKHNTLIDARLKVHVTDFDHKDCIEYIETDVIQVSEPELN